LPLQLDLPIFSAAMSDYMDVSSPTQPESPREFFVSAELYVSTMAATMLRKVCGMQQIIHLFHF
jgi:hypothetical protein